MNRKEEYHHYLRSSKWHTIRKTILEERGCKCEKCKRVMPMNKLHLHHLTYKHIFNELEHKKDLKVLCEDCHNELHRMQKKGVITLRGIARKPRHHKSKKEKREQEENRAYKSYARKIEKIIEKKYEMAGA